LGDFVHARKLYEEGGHVGSYAHLTLLKPPSNKEFPKGTIVLGFTEDGGNVFANLLEEAKWGDIPDEGNVTVKVHYVTSDVQSHHVDCMVGALVSLEAGYRAGCKCFWSVLSLEK
jgi:hypothetical protein